MINKHTFIILCFNRSNSCDLYFLNKFILHHKSIRFLLLLDICYIILCYTLLLFNSIIIKVIDEF